jgi:hypothetical protein
MDPLKTTPGAIMDTKRTTRSAALMALAISPVLFVAGCATAPPTAERMSVAPMGTVATYHRKSSGSLGRFDSQVVWTHTPTTWQGKPAILFSAPQQVASVHDAVSLHGTGVQLPIRRDYRVEAFEDVTVPAGTFKAWKLFWKDSTGETETRWFSPEAGLATIKRHVERHATHAQGPGQLDAELVSLRVLSREALSK